MSEDLSTDARLAIEARTPSLRTKALQVFASTILAAALSFVFVLLVARSAGPVVRGGLAFTVAVPNLLSFASTLGMETSNLYFAARDRDLRPALVTISMLQGVVIGGALAGAAGLLFTIAPSLVPDGLPRDLLSLGLATTPVIAIQFVLIAGLIGSGRVPAANAVKVTMPAVSLLAFVASTIGAQGGLRSAVLSWTAGQVCGCVLAVALAMRYMGIGSIRKSRPVLRPVLAYGLRAHVGNLADIATYRVDTLILAAYRGSAEVGIYAVAVNAAEVLLYLPTAVGNVVLPARAAGGPGRRRRGERLVARIAIVLPTLALVGIATAGFVIPAVFGHAFAGSVAPTRILMIAMIGMGMRRVVRAELAAVRRQGTASAIAVVTLAIVLGLDLMLIPGHGAAGAAWASLIAYVIGGALTVATWKRGPDDPDGPLDRAGVERT